MRMRMIKWMLSLIVVVGMAVIVPSCDDDEPPALTLMSLTADGVDLNGATSATGVKVGSTIVATFNVAVDAASASTAIMLMRDFDDASFATAVSVNGAEVTINPTSDFSTGTLFILSFGAGLTSTE